MSISIQDLKNLYSKTTESSQMEIELCYSKETILVKPLKTKDKKELLKSLESKNEIIVNKVLDDIIQKYCEKIDGTSVDHLELTTQERQQILVYIRVANGDTECKIAHQCPKCEEVNRNISFKTDSLILNEFEGKYENEVIQIGQGKFIFELNVIRRKDEIIGENYIKKNKLKTMTEKQYVMMATAIKSAQVDVNGSKQDIEFTSIDEKISFLENLNTRDSNKILSYLETLDFGVKLPFEFKCSKCDHESTQEVNVAVFFIS
jgi:phage FluMu protein Com